MEKFFNAIKDRITSTDPKNPGFFVTALLGGLLGALTGNPLGAVAGLLLGAAAGSLITNDKSFDYKDAPTSGTAKLVKADIAKVPVMEAEVPTTQKDGETLVSIGDKTTKFTIPVKSKMEFQPTAAMLDEVNETYRNLARSEMFPDLSAKKMERLSGQQNEAFYSYVQAVGQAAQQPGLPEKLTHIQFKVPAHFAQSGAISEQLPESWNDMEAIEQLSLIEKANHDKMKATTATAHELSQTMPELEGYTKFHNMLKGALPWTDSTKEAYGKAFESFDKGEITEHEFKVKTKEIGALVPGKPANFLQNQTLTLIESKRLKTEAEEILAVKKQWLRDAFNWETNAKIYVAAANNEPSVEEEAKKAAKDTSLAVEQVDGTDLLVAQHTPPNGADADKSRTTPQKPANL